MVLDLTVALLVRNPPMERLVAQIDYMSAVASEFIIVDTGSSDHDLQAMAALNKSPFGLPKVKLVRREWRDDFAWARNEGLPHVTRKWTLHLDPDELPNVKMMEYIRDVVTLDTTKALGITFFSVNYFNGFREAEQGFHWHLRMFRSGHGRWYRALDELVALDGRPEHDTRGTATVLKAPKDAYFIHSKDGHAIEQSERLYERMRADGAYLRGLLDE